MTAMIPKMFIGMEGITEIVLSFWRTVNHDLDRLLGTFPNDLATKNATCLSINQGQDVDSVFLLPINENISSILAVVTSSGIGVVGNCSA